MPWSRSIGWFAPMVAIATIAMPSARSRARALHSAFYPGVYPFQHGGIARVAGALCFYLTQAHAFYDGNKRTALIASLTSLDFNGWSIEYPLDVDGKTAVADLIERCADGKVTRDEMIEWWDQHKVKVK